MSRKPTFTLKSVSTASQLWSRSWLWSSWSSSPGFEWNHGFKRMTFRNGIGRYWSMVRKFTHMSWLLNTANISAATFVWNTDESLISTPSQHDLNGPQKQLDLLPTPFKQMRQHHITTLKWLDVYHWSMILTSFHLLLFSEFKLNPGKPIHSPNTNIAPQNRPGPERRWIIFLSPLISKAMLWSIVCLFQGYGSFVGSWSLDEVGGFSSLTSSFWWKLNTYHQQSLEPFTCQEPFCVGDFRLPRTRPTRSPKSPPSRPSPRKSQDPGTLAKYLWKAWHQTCGYVRRFNIRGHYILVSLMPQQYIRQNEEYQYRCL